MSKIVSCACCGLKMVNPHTTIEGPNGKLWHSCAPECAQLIQDYVDPIDESLPEVIDIDVATVPELSASRASTGQPLSVWLDDEFADAMQYG